MKQTYTHLTQDQRYTISQDLKSGKRISQIAKDLGVCRQTIWRELKRNTGLRGYRHGQAHQKACARKLRNTSKVTEFGHCFIIHKLRQRWSPEQISCALKAQGWLDVPSTEWIYQLIYSKRGQQLSLRSYLRCQKTYRKRNYKTRDRRGKMSQCKSIHERPIEADQRTRIGDLEGDTIIGQHHKGAVLTLVDRKTLFTWIEPLENRYAQNTANACIQALSGFNAHTITFDNGKEFAEFAHIEKQTHAQIFFADPYQSNQRARNENTNGLIRQYLPKKIPLDNLSKDYVQNIALELNNRPRKSLNWLTPAQAFAGNFGVALRS